MSFSIVDEERPTTRPRKPYPKPPPGSPVPEYAVVTKITEGNRPPRRVRRNWQPVLDELLAGNMLFMSLSELTDQNVKYLTLALFRRARDERLRYQREERDGVLGRLVWVETD